MARRSAQITGVRGCGALDCRSGGSFGLALGLGIRSQAEFDDGARVGDELGLPAVVGLELLHGGLGAAVPVSGGVSGEIPGVDQGGLDLCGAGIVNRPLRGGFGRGVGAVMIEQPL